MTGGPPRASASPRKSSTRRLYDAFGQAEVSTIYSELNQYYVVMEVAPKYWHSPEGLKDTYLVPTPGRRCRPTQLCGQVRAFHHAPRREPHRPLPICPRSASTSRPTSPSARQRRRSCSSSNNSASRNRSTASSPAPCRPSSSPSPASLTWSPPRSSPCTSCSASCTKA